jgi:hypothetical protein
MSFSFKSINTLFPFLLTGVFSFILAWNLVFSPATPFAYSESEHLNLLFAENFSPIGSFRITAAFPPTVMNAHPLTVFLLIVARLFPANPIFLLWLGQTLLCAALFYRTAIFLHHRIDQPYRFAVYVLLSCNPLFWSTLFYSPSHAITTLFIIESMSHHPAHERNGIKWFFSLFLLSLCGSTGIWFALLIALLVPLVYFCREVRFDWKNPILLRMSAIALAALLPAITTVLMLSLQSGVFGGAHLIGWPTLFSSMTIPQLLTGEWSHTFRSLLIWCGNGCISLSYSLPIFGILLLLGSLSWLQKKNSHPPFGVIFFGFVGASFFFYALLPTETAKECFFPLYLLGLIAAVHGLCEVAKTISWQTNAIMGPLIGVLAFLSIYSFPHSLQEKTVVARYKRDLWSTIHLILKKSDLTVDDPIAIRFTPSLWTQLSPIASYYPIDLAVRHMAPSPPKLIRSGVRTLIEYQPRSSGGVRLDLGKSLLLAPKIIFLYPSFEEARQELFHSAETNRNDRWTEILETYYVRTRLRNVQVFEKADAGPGKVVGSALEQLIREGRIEEYEQLSSFSDFPGEPYRTSFAHLPDLSKNEQLAQIGVNWTFEENYQNTLPTGIAFGLSPDHTSSAVGAASAGPGSDNANGEVGELHSLPFIMEGDEMSFFADLPKESTASLFCLAVHSKEPVGENLPIKQVRHIFEHHPDEPLLADTFFYVRPSQLLYADGSVIGWRVVRALHGGEVDGWQFVSWSTNPWINQQALWIAADRDINGTVRIDHILQRKRTDCFYWNFENGDYEGWTVSGSAFGDGPATGSFGKQHHVQGFEGNYFVNTFHQGSDQPTGTMTSHSFTITMDRIEFLIGGGDDPDAIAVRLLVNGEIALHETGKQTEQLRKIVWDVSAWEGKEAKLELVDQSSEPWGHLLVDDIRLYNTLPRRLQLIADADKSSE